MSHSFSRRELFDLVWSETTRTIAKRLGISDGGLANACRRADLLLPPRVCWTKLAAGEVVQKMGDDAECSTVIGKLMSSEAHPRQEPTNDHAQDGSPSNPGPRIGRSCVS